MRRRDAGFDIDHLNPSLHVGGVPHQQYRLNMPNAQISYRKAESLTLNRFISMLSTADDRMIGVMAAAYVDTTLERIIAVAEPNLKRWVVRTNFNNRINKARKLDLVNEVAHADLHKIRKIRNEFAHNLSAFDFDHPNIEPCCEFGTVNVSELAPATPQDEMLRTLFLEVVGRIVLELVLREEALHADSS